MGTVDDVTVHSTTTSFGTTTTPTTVSRLIRNPETSVTLSVLRFLPRFSTRGNWGLRRRHSAYVVRVLARYAVSTGILSLPLKDLLGLDSVSALFVF